MVNQNIQSNPSSTALDTHLLKWYLPLQNRTAKETGLQQV